MRIGDRGLLAAGTVARRARHRPGACGADGQRAVGHTSDRAAAGADRHHVHHRQRQRPLADVAALRQRDLPAAQQADIGTGAADIDRDDVADTGCRRHIARTHDAGGGARQHGERRCPADRGGTGDAAVRLHEQQGCGDIGVGQTALQPAHIRADRRHHAGIHDRRQAALVLAHHRQHVHRCGHRDLRQRGAQQFGHAALMRGIRERVQQADRNGLHIEPAQRRGNVMHARFVERHQHDAARTDALAHLQDARRRHRTLRLHPGEQIGMARNVLPTDLQHMAKTGGGDQRGARGLAFQDQVGGDRRAVQHAADLLRPCAGVGSAPASRRQGTPPTDRRTCSVSWRATDVRSCCPPA